MSSAQQGWRTTVGSCGSRGVVQVSQDGGKTWHKVAANPRLSSVAALQAVGRDTLFVIGGRQKCKATYVTSYVSGDEWVKRQQHLKDSWYLTPGNRNEVRAPGGDRSRPCPGTLISLASVDDRHGAVLCATGAIWTSTNAGRSWRLIGRLPGGAALGSANHSYIAGSIVEGCKGVKLVHIDRNAKTVHSSKVCARMTGVRRGRVAVAQVGTSIWVWAGRTLAVSRDSGRTW